MSLLEPDREYLTRKGLRYSTEPHNGMLALVVHDWSLPSGYDRAASDLLFFLPGGFPDAGPDMWWMSPWVRLRTGADPVATSQEPLLGRVWQRFSRHFTAVPWRSGRSGVESFLTLIRKDLEQNAS